jgi:hypothetical protein
MRWVWLRTLPTFLSKLSTLSWRMALKELRKISLNRYVLADPHSFLIGASPTVACCNFSVVTDVKLCCVIHSSKKTAG